MKKSIKVAALMVAGMATMVACKQGNGNENLDEKLIAEGYTAYYENDVPKQ